MDAQSLQLKRYLLGDLSDEERAELDLKLLTDSDFFVLVELAEEDLIEDYLDHSLDKSENERFEEHFLVPPERRHQLVLSKQLREYAKASTPPVADAGSDQIATTIWSFMRFHPVFSFSFAAILVCVGLGVAYLVWQNQVGFADDPQNLELARLNQQDLNNLSEFPNADRLSLVPASTREPSTSPRISLRSDSELVLLRMGLPNDWSDGVASAQVFGENIKPLELKVVTVYQSEAGRDLRILIPRAFLGVGNYRIEVTSTGNREQVATYVFEVAP